MDTIFDSNRIIYYCPRCNSTNIIEYDKSFDCPLCGQEFEKVDFERFDVDDILSVEEKRVFVKALIDIKKDEV